MDFMFRDRRRPRRGAFSGGVLLAVGALWACARDPGEVPPAEALTAFLTAVERSAHAPDQQEKAYFWVDQASQRALEQRAALTESLAGHALDPWDFLVPGRVSFAGQAVASASMSERIEGDRAVVEVPIADRERAEISMVRQEGRWRVLLGLGDK